ncbi:acyltransferase [Halonotius sp. GCM10025705]|uniref:acyltransferase n=1 Tax=Halonotius sp. GCM10025705 TaxID=3252678 RepID=UPI00361D5902
MSSITTRLRQLRDVGVRGGAKSVYYSLRHTSSASALVFTSQVITDISANTTFDVNNRFTVGTGRRGATHPRIGRSKVSTVGSASVSHTGEVMASIGPASVLHVEGDFSMGDSYINGHSRILCGDEISIGDGVAMAWNIELLDDDRHAISVDGERTDQSTPIKIEDDVWVGHDVSVHKGVTIHEGSIVASDSVVTSDVPPNTLVAGTPAKVVREDVEWG